MSIRSTDMSASLSTEHATSSMSIDVPRVRCAPTFGMSPLRMSQNTCASLGSSRNGKFPASVSGAEHASCDVGCSTGTPDSCNAVMVLAMRARSSSGDAPRHSMSNPAVFLGQPASPGVSAAISFDFSASASAARSKTSIAAAQPAVLSAAVARPASWNDGYSTKVDALLGCSSTVLYVAREIKPSVPSEPTSSFLMISIGSSGATSTKALIEYPVVHLMANFLWMSAVSASSACTSRASAETPSQTSLPNGDVLNAATDAGSDVSSVVPSTKTTRRSRNVWYVFCATPQHMPDELLLTMPPIMHESIEAGSGPRRYCVAHFFLRAYDPRSRFTSPPMSPGSTVTTRPSSPMACRRQFLPVCDSLSRIESVTACPESEVPAARKVTGVPWRAARGSSLRTSSSVSILSTILGTRR
mmetsp:Transcript_14119/g.56273  ORF Transcript_14119/g.56273 Transcript_14119/m.56273 type:complete len:415 (+) Transcript_14119:2060-3304(+)